jgi:hypothetical protein
MVEARPRARQQRLHGLRAPLLALSLALPLVACAGSSPKVNYAAPTPEQERVFEHGVDFVAALEGLEGRWRDDYEKDLQERVAGSDFIGVVKVGTMLTETDPEQRVTYRLVGTIKRTIAGTDLKDLELRVRQGQLGFPTIQENLQRLEQREFVVFVKWYQDDQGERAAHFHLSPASEQIVSATESSAMLAKKAPTGSAPAGRTVVHNN